MTDDRAQALWAAILAAPDDDGPRLVLADHWIALGDPRGELITVQCALAHTPGDRNLLAREQELLPLTAHGRRDLVARARQHRIHRGFIDDISFESPRFDLEALRSVLAHPERYHGAVDDNETLICDLTRSARNFGLPPAAMAASATSASRLRSTRRRAVPIRACRAMSA